MRLLDAVALGALLVLRPSLASHSAVPRQSTLHRAAVSKTVGERREGRLRTIVGRTMGTTYRVHLSQADAYLLASHEYSAQAVKTRIDRRLDELEKVFSTYREDSEVTKFNRGEFSTQEPLIVSTDFGVLLEQALALHRETQGSFDITVGPLVRALGFGAGKGAPESLSGMQAGAGLKARIGTRLLSYNAATRALSKRNPAVECDFSAIAKGYAADQISALLVDNGLKNHLVEIGGEVRVNGSNDNRAFRVAIEVPDESTRTPLRTLTLRKPLTGVATSGNYRQYRVVSGRRVSHIVDPRSKRATTHALASVTVLARSAARADALATALYVMGPSEARTFAETHNLAALFVVRKETAGDRFIVYRSTRFSEVFGDS